MKSSESSVALILVVEAVAVALAEAVEDTGLAAELADSTMLPAEVHRKRRLACQRTGTAPVPDPAAVRHSLQSLLAPEVVHSLPSEVRCRYNNSPYHSDLHSRLMVC